MDKISQYVAWLGSNPWLAISSFFIAIVGIILAIGFYLKSRRLKIPCYSIRSINVVQDLISKFESLEIRYAGDAIENLTVTKLAFWNWGKETINSSDIASADPLLVRATEGYKILEAKVIYANNPANQFSIIDHEDKTAVSLNFDYLDKNEGAVIQIIHTGTTNDHIQVTGTIKGAGKMHHRAGSSFRLVRMTNRAISRFSTKFYRVWFGFAFLLSPFMALVFFLLRPLKSSAGRDVSKGVLLLSVFIAALPYWALAFVLLRRRMPKGFDAFEKDS